MPSRCRASHRAAALALAAVAVRAAPLAAQAAPPAQTQTVVPIKPTLFMITGGGGNVAVWVSNHGVVLVDDKLGGEANFADLVAAVRRITPLPVRAVFVTHHHADHVGNNGRFLAANVVVIGADGVGDALARTTPPGREPAAPPNVTFASDYAVILDTGRVEAHHYRPAHTCCDAVVHFAAAHAVALGGLVVDGTPTFDYDGGVDIGGWIATLDDVLRLDFDTAVPGRGPVVGKAEIAAFRDRLTVFRDRAQAAVRSGATAATLIEQVPVADLGWMWSATAWPPASREGLWREMRAKWPSGRSR